MFGYSLFQGVKNLGQDAVNAIDNYKEVVSSLNDSLQMALQANKTMSETVSLLQAVSIDDLNTQAASALDLSQQMLKLVNSWNSTAGSELSENVLVYLVSFIINSVH